MSETLRDLVVSLSLQTDNFTRNIKSVNKQIAEAESKFRLAAAGVEGFERTTTGLSTQLSTLQRRMSLQQQAVTQYERALAAANSKLQECYSRQTDYAQRLTDARAAQEALKTQVAAAAQQVRVFSATLGDSDSATIAAKANLDALKTEYRASVQEVRKLAGQNTALQKSAQNAADAVSTAGTNLNNSRAAVRNTQAEIDRCNQSLRLAQTNWDAAGQAIDESRAAITTFGKQIALAESRFKLASVGIKELDTSVAGLAAKQTLLTEKLDLQRRSLTQYEAALQGAKEQLKAAQQANDPEKIRQANDAVIDAEAALNRAKTAVAATRVEIEQTNQLLATAKSAWTAAGKSLEDFGRKCDAIGKGMTTAGRTLSTAVTTPIIALGTTAVKASLDFESTFTSVRKTVDATEAEFDALAEASKTMSTQIATSAGEINEVMATAGQLGHPQRLSGGLRPHHDRPWQLHGYRGQRGGLHTGEVCQHHEHGPEPVRQSGRYAGGSGQQLCDDGIVHHGDVAAPCSGGPSGGADGAADPGLCGGAVVGGHRGRNGRLGVFQVAGQDGGCRGYGRRGAGGFCPRVRPDGGGLQGAV